MKQFIEHRGIAAPLRLTNVDTDKILPGRFLKTITREGLGQHLFHSMRYAATGEENPDFILNRLPWRKASILIALDNFGCGSSREHAPWALADFGIRAIIAPSFADIFYNNCFKNGILPIALPSATVDKLLELALREAEMHIGLPGQRIETSLGGFNFEIDPDRKHALIHGLDDISVSEARLPDIERFEQSKQYPSPPIGHEIFG